MPTTVVKTIGNGTRDYTSIQAWEDAAPANLVTADQVWEGQLYPEGAGTNGEWTITSFINISGSTSDATRFKRLRCAPGMSFSDNASAATNALRYNTANGVAIRQTNNYGGSAVSAAESYAEIIGLQLSNYNGADTLLLSSSNTTAKNCVLIHTVGRGAVSSAAVNGRVINSALIAIGTGVSVYSSNSPVSLIGCTIIRPSGTSALCVASYGGAVLLKDCAAFGFTGSTGVSASSSYNATDLATFPGTNNQLSLAAATQFENTTYATLDLRAKTGNGLQFGVTDALISTDIIGQTRAATPTIGAWEFGAVGGGSASATFTLSTDSPTFSLAANVAGGPATATFAINTDSPTFSLAASVAAAGSFVSDVLINNTGTVLASQAVFWSWLPLGRIGSLASVTEVDGTGTTSAGGVLTATGLSPGAGILLIAKRNTSAVDDHVYYQAGTVT